MVGLARGIDMRPLHNASADLTALTEGELLRLARNGDPGAFRTIMQRNNLRLYRVARSVLGEDSEVEDVLQEAYVRALAGLADFRGQASLSTWLTRIVVNEALGRIRKQRPMVSLEAVEGTMIDYDRAVVPFPLSAQAPDPERATARREIRSVVERLIEELPEPFRVVFVMRAVEEMSVEETACILQLQPETVRTRLHRARQSLRRALEAEFASALTDTFPFDARRCNRVVDAVVLRLKEAGLLEGR
jgi:RNA polymerase sigma-70 factor (ECF subfamily)